MRQTLLCRTVGFRLGFLRIRRTIVLIPQEEPALERLIMAADGKSFCEFFAGIGLVWEALKKLGMELRLQQRH